MIADSMEPYSGMDPVALLLAVALGVLVFVVLPIVLIRWILRINEVVLLLKHMDALLRSINEKLGENRPGGRN